MWLPAVLFVATCASTWLTRGPVFAATLMAILVTHELGHWVAARRHGVPVSPPYFIPLPFIGLGTLGAVIRMKAPIERRDALFDVGAAGPLAGLALAVPLLFIGLLGSPVAALPPGTTSMTEGNSLLYLAMKLVAKGRILPAGPLDVQLGDMAFAAWTGLLLTFINLIPIGQLDGGHVATAYFGEKQERLARWLHRGLAVCGAAVVATLFIEARGAGRTSIAALGYGALGALPWLVWIVLLAVMRRGTGGRYHPPVDAEPLSASRRGLCILMAVVFVLLFTPVPMRLTL
jgi:membrane-associated protease RseP (regulator of RpoE activity)